MRRALALLPASALLVAALAPAAAAPSPPSPPAPGTGAAALAQRLGLQSVPKGVAASVPGKEDVRPAGPNPWLALLPDPTKTDLAGWKAYGAAQSAERATSSARRAAVRAALPSASSAALGPPIVVDEEEPLGRGSNDTTATAQPVDGFGTARGQDPRARILGELDPLQGTVSAIPPNVEDDGSIPLARDTGVGTTRRGATTTGTIGDGPHGRAAGGTGDFDVYAVRAAAGETISVAVDTPTGTLDPMVAVYDAAGTQVAFNDDAGGSAGLDSRVSYTVTTPGAYYVFVTGYRVLPRDPDDPASGTGAGSQGPYTVTIRLDLLDVDFYAVRLRAGDVLGATVSGAATRIAVYDPAGRDVHGSSQDASFIYPVQSPLPGGGDAVTDHIAAVDGWHYVQIAQGAGRYDATLEVYRPGLEGTRQVQTLYLDVDGARVNTGVFGGRGVTTLSPLRSFLARWGLTNADLDPLITAITAEVRENVRRDLAASGLNRRFAVRVVNSRDVADPFGQPNVSRLVIGGTIEESGVPTIGIAQSIDPGNYAMEETALVLLDLLSDPAGPGFSLNTYLRPQSDRVAFVAQAVGNVTSHEAGHYLGNWHTDNANTVPNLMDQGGLNFQILFGVGPDGVGGTADDVDVDFGEDHFVPNEGFTGIEDTRARTAFGLSR